MKNWKSYASFFAFLCCLSTSAFAQILNPVHWAFDSKKISDTEYELISTAKLDKNWNIYSQFLASDDGPIRTVFSYKLPAGAQLVGKTEEISDHKKAGYDKLFDMNVIKYSESVRFVQRVKFANAANVTGSVRFGTCDDEQCLPPNDVDFTFKIAAAASAPKAPTALPAPNPATPAAPNAPKNTPSTNGKNIAPSNNGAAKINQHGPNVSPDPVQVQSVQATEPSSKNPVSWAFESTKINDTEYDLRLTATIAKGWHIYSQFTAEGGPVPAEITVSNAELVGKAKEESAHRREHKEPLFDNIKVIDFSEKVTFVQRIKVKTPLAENAQIKGEISVQACNDQQCIPPDAAPFAINATTGKAEKSNPNADATSPVMPSNGGEVANNPVTKFQFDATRAATACENGSVGVAKDTTNLWLLFIGGFLGGLVALLTPCVFPMIPLTVGFFTKRSKDRATGLRNALIYGSSIIVIYTALGLLITILAGPEALNQLSTNVVMNIIFGVLFVVFAISFFGFFEITLPSSWSTKADAAADRGGLIGIFFMAFTLALVSFSCTGPLIGNLLVTASQGGRLAPAVGMFGFSLALALPFMLFSAFPAWLNTLPKSGGWMNDVKVTLGFVEVALAFKFFSVADLTMGWKIVPYELMLGVWVLCALGLVLHFSGLVSFYKGAPRVAPKGGRLAMLVLSLAALVYLGLGFRYSPQSETFQTPELASGIMPPAGHSYIYPKSCPLNLNCFHDLEEGMAYARQVKKPILLDFTGYGCVNCRKMEDNVWGKPGVYELIRDKYVLVSLYTDDRKLLDKPYMSTFDQKEKKNVGQKWSDFEAIHFNRNSQPYYVLIEATDGNKFNILNAPRAYTPVVKDYQAFLECGLSRFSNLK
jgi:thiol:disulfide interchange protein